MRRNNVIALVVNGILTAIVFVLLIILLSGCSMYNIRKALRECPDNSILIISDSRIAMLPNSVITNIPAIITNQMIKARVLTTTNVVETQSIDIATIIDLLSNLQGTISSYLTAIEDRKTKTSNARFGLIYKKSAGFSTNDLYIFRMLLKDLNNMIGN